MNLLMAFMPFLAFALLSRPLGTPSALVAAALLCAWLVIRGRWRKEKRSFKLLEVGSLILFGALALVTLFSRFAFSILQVRLIVDLGLLAIVLGSVLVGRPFTMQYAVEQVSPEMAATERFRKMALQIALAWVLAFIVIVAADLAMLRVMAFTPTMGTLAIMAALAGAAWFSAWWPERGRP